MPRSKAPLAQLDPVDFALPISDVDTPIAVEFTDGVVGVLEVTGSKHARDAKLTIAGKIDPRVLKEIPRGSDVGDVVIALTNERPLRAFTLPPGRIKHDVNLRLYGYRAIALLVATVLFLVAALLPLPSILRGLMMAVATVAIIIALFVHGRRWPSTRFRYVSEGTQRTFSTLLDDRPAGERATKLVERVKEEYGKLASDIVYRIENPALFDPGVETTAEFTSAMMQWEDSRNRLTGSEVSALAARLRVLFDTAKQNAETLGMEHLPEEAREPAGRALGALRIAKSRGASASEKATAMKQASKILGSLMLYYLPRPAEVEALVAGRTLKALPGRHVPVEEDIRVEQDDQEQP